MNSSTTEAKGWDDDCPWPRRLLHVSTLTSFEWQPGNIYNGTIEPEYNTISYTWGRYTLKKGEKPQIRSFPIKGVPWVEHLPRIEPSHFTTEDLQLAIDKMACPYMGYTRVEFIWLDVACIDQTPDSEQNAAEVGRQAKIFRGAKDSFIWLTKLAISGLNCWLLDMTKLFSKSWPQFGALDPNIPHSQIIEDLNSAVRLLNSFLQDPWFSSLWTLQEAFLRSNAVFILRDGMPQLDFHEDDEQDDGYLTLEKWASILLILRGRIQHAESLAPELVAELCKTIDHAGFLDGLSDQWSTTQLGDFRYNRGDMGNPFGLLASAQYRRTTQENDKVYAIMQVFDLRLGRSAPGQNQNRFDLSELQHQLASSLITRYPLFSQMFVQGAKCPPSNGWMVNEHVSIIPEAMQAWSHQTCGGRINQPTSLTARNHQGYSLAQFSGPLANLSAFRDLVPDLTRVLPRFRLDKKWCSDDNVFREDWSSYHPGIAFDWIDRAFPEAKVVLLGRLSAPIETIDIHDLDLEYFEWGIGLLLQENQGQERWSGGYRRLGIMIWEAEEYEVKKNVSRTAAQFLRGEGPRWTFAEGLFG